MMEIKESNDHRVYMTEYGIPTVQLGCGGVIISTLSYNGEDITGVGFSLGVSSVGDDHPEMCGKNAVDVNVFFQIASTSPESFQVLIDALTKAKSELENNLKPTQ